MHLSNAPQNWLIQPLQSPQSEGVPLFKHWLLEQVCHLVLRFVPRIVPLVLQGPFPGNHCRLPGLRLPPPASYRVTSFAPEVYRGLPEASGLASGGQVVQRWGVAKGSSVSRVAKFKGDKNAE